jgi:DNA-3-methyladenine glycosylase
VIVESEAYSQEEPSCHDYRLRSPSNEILFGEPGHWYVYRTYGINRCVNVLQFITLQLFLVEDCLRAPERLE